MTGFGQSESLVQNISESILKYYQKKNFFSEYIQNAEDSGATCIDFILDESFYPDKSVISETAHVLQGPSLVVRNNSIFTEEDFEGITRLKRSEKSKKPNKIGRFGMGLSTAYYYSNTILLLSCNDFVLLDPQSSYVPQPYAGEGGIRMKYDKAQHFRDQYRPFFSYGFNPSSFFNGTLFRLPLRMKDQKTNFKYVDKPDPTIQSIADSIEVLFEEDECSKLMYFLRNIRLVRFYRKCDIWKTIRLLFQMKNDVTSRFALYPYSVFANIILMLESLSMVEIGSITKDIESNSISRKVDKSMLPREDELEGNNEEGKDEPKEVIESRVSKYREMLGKNFDHKTDSLPPSPRKLPQIVDHVINYEVKKVLVRYEKTNKPRVVASQPSPIFNLFSFGRASVQEPPSLPQFTEPKEQISKVLHFLSLPSSRDSNSILLIPIGLKVNSSSEAPSINQFPKFEAPTFQLPPNYSFKSELFCFLPTGIKIQGLPFFVNGNFELDSERAHVVEHDAMREKLEKNKAIVNSLKECVFNLIQVLEYMIENSMSLNDCMSFYFLKFILYFVIFFCFCLLCN